MDNSTTSESATYILDTNILIGFALWRPIPMSTSFWDRMSETLAEGKWILLNEVVDEIKYNKPLEKWCRQQKSQGLITNLPDECRYRGFEINGDYSMIDLATGGSTVDTYIIAYAELNKVRIFTRESHRDSNKPDALYKIPDVCDKLKIKFTRKPETFLRDIDF